MNRVYNFSAGPSMLPLPVLEKAAAELVCYGESGMSVMEMSHRSPDYEAIINEAEAMLRIRATVKKITQLEGLEAEPDEIAEALAVICRQNDITMEQLKPYYDAEFEKAVVRSVLSTKATKLIRDAAILTETA